MASASQAKPPKGILKKPSNWTSSSAAAEPFPSSFATKDEEARVMATFPVIEALTSFPQERGPQLTAAQPSEHDAMFFKTEVTKLTRSEFSDLVEERNCEGKCGYVLCPSGRRNFKNEFRIWKGDIAATKNLNKWCSDACARRALNVQLQLGVTPTYGLAAAKPVELLGEESKSTEDSSTETKKISMEPSMSNKTVNKQKEADFQEDVVIMEKTVTEPPVAPSNEASTMPNGHLVLEGYRTNFGTVSLPLR